MQSFRFHSYPPILKTIADVIHHMRLLGEELKDTDLENLIAFNHTYLIITRNVTVQFGRNYFDDDQRMETLDINFAYYYFNALRDYIENKPVAPSWKILFDHCRQDDLLQSSYMALGVNAHVNNDLAFSLYDCISDFGYKNDFDKINYIIKKSLKEVVCTLHEKNSLINTLKDKLLILYAFILNLLIQNWRKNAWNNFVKLKEKNLNTAKIKNKAAATAQMLKFKKL